MTGILNEAWPCKHCRETRAVHMRRRYGEVRAAGDCSNQPPRPGEPRTKYEPMNVIEVLARAIERSKATWA